MGVIDETKRQLSNLVKTPFDQNVQSHKDLSNEQINKIENKSSTIQPKKKQIEYTPADLKGYRISCEVLNEMIRHRNFDENKPNRNKITFGIRKALSCLIRISKKYNYTNEIKFKMSEYFDLYGIKSHSTGKNNYIYALNNLIELSRLEFIGNAEDSNKKHYISSIATTDFQYDEDDPINSIKNTIVTTKFHKVAFKAIGNYYAIRNEFYFLDIQKEAGKRPSEVLMNFLDYISTIDKNGLMNPDGLTFLVGIDTLLKVTHLDLSKKYRNKNERINYLKSQIDIAIKLKYVDNYIIKDDNFIITFLKGKLSRLELEPNQKKKYKKRSK